MQIIGFLMTRLILYIFNYRYMLKGSSRKEKWLTAPVIRRWNSLIYDHLLCSLNFFSVYENVKKYLPCNIAHSCAFPIISRIFSSLNLRPCSAVADAPGANADSVIVDILLNETTILRFSQRCTSIIRVLRKYIFLFPTS